MTTIIKNIIYLTLILILLPATMVTARDRDTENVDIEALRQKLDSVRKQTREQAEQLAQSRASKQKMETLVECSWKMLKGYEDCESEFDKTTKSYLSCVNKAKSSNQRCTQEANKADK